MTNSSATIGSDRPRLNLSEMGKLLMRAPTPIGFIISQALSTTLEQRFRQEQPHFTAGHVPDTWNGIKVVVDPTMPGTEFEAVLTPEAWSRRLRELRGDGEQSISEKEG